MTIAAGFLCREGIVLCADTHHTGAVAAKTHQAKVGDFEWAGGKVAFAVAGHKHLAWSAIQKLKIALGNTPAADMLSVMERVLDKEYRKQVFANPSYSTGVFDYWLLLAVWTRPNTIQLFATNQTAVLPVDGFECIGTGAELAHYLINPCFGMHMPDRRAMHLATYALSCVKETIEGCSGPTIFTVLRKDGSTGVTTTNSAPWKQIEEFSKTYNYLSRKLFLNLANFETPTSDFERTLTDYFVPQIMKVRKEWEVARRMQIRRFAGLNPRLTDAQVEQSYLLWTMGLSPVLPASPELPEGSGES